MSETVAMLDGRTFRVGPCGFYEELIEVPLDSLVMSEGGQYPERVQRYVKMHRAGSPFPPIAVAGVTPDCPGYRITNGHHRFLRQAHRHEYSRWQGRFLRQAQDRTWLRGRWVPVPSGPGPVSTYHSRARIGGRATAWPA
ncbi:MAG: hypothetical protein SXV54_06595 [Chloroflexota bacterium]|nr:hypothetical protein [Chloroflexota bacterium]